VAASAGYGRISLLSNETKISEDLSRRIDMLASRSMLTRAQIIEDALFHGRSLALQEKLPVFRQGSTTPTGAISQPKTKSRQF
jgi:hypothetical protein